MGDLTPAEWRAIDEHFESQIFPVLTPLAVDPGHPFPYISNLSLSLAVEVRDPRARHGALRAREGAEEPAALGAGARARAPVRAARAGDRREPRGAVPGNGDRRLVRVPRHALLRPRVPEPRGAGRPARDDRGAGVRAAVRRSDPARGAGRHAGAPARAAARRAARRGPSGGELAQPRRTSRRRGTCSTSRDLMEICASSTCPSCAIRRSRAACPSELRDPQRSIFDVIRERDILVHHPFDSFSRHASSASSQRRRRTIRCSRSSSRCIARRATRRSSRALDRGRAARQAGRGDRRAQGALRRGEQHHRGRARSRTPACTSRIGSAELKTHTKTALVVRREPDGIRRYVHLGTRQLQLAHGAAVHRRRPVHLQPVDRRRRQRSVQLAHRLSRGSGSTASSSSRRRTCRSGSSS